MNLVKASKVHISELKYGTVVYNIDTNKHGHIVGFATNSFNETILKVQWESFFEESNITKIHPTNVGVYTND